MKGKLLFNRKKAPREERIYLPTVRVDPETGLSREQVAERTAAGFTNVPVKSETRSVREIIRRNTLTYFNMIFVFLAVLLIMVRSYRDMLFMGVIICNTMIGIVQELRSKAVLDELKIMSAPRSRVIRAGQKEEILTEELVLDDIIELAAGNQIPADAVVVSGNVRVNESLLTGEADEITRTQGQPLLSGSFVVSGSCRAMLTAVGEDSYISKLTLTATAMKGGERSEMIKALDRLVKMVGIIIIPLGILLFYQQFYVRQVGFRDSVTNMVAGVIGMIPEGLYLTASVALAVSAMRLARKKVLIHEMKSMETLARVTVMCVDKTGTITEDHMEVKGFLTGLNLGAAPEPEKSSNQITDVLQRGKRQLTAMLNQSGSAVTVDRGEEDFQDVIPLRGEALKRTAENSAGSQAIRELLSDIVQGMPRDNETMRALQAYFTQGKGEKPTRVFPFSSRTKYSGAVLGGVSYVLGAPEYLLGDDYELYQEFIESHGENGYRVLAFGSYSGELDGQPLDHPVRLMGTILLANRVRDGAAATFRYFAERDVAIKVISGDNPVSVSAIAKEAGIAGAESFVDARDLKTPAAIEEAMQKYTVFGRVTPEQKRQFVKALQKAGEIVAMTGDGVNDVLALKDADCSIAMASGSEAASQVAQLVLLDSDFSKMPDVVLEGRRVVNNIERTASLFLVKNIFSLLLSVFSVILMIDYPLEAAQLSLISLFTIGTPAFLLSQEPNKDPIRGHFLTNVLLQALPAGLTDFAVVLSLVLFCREFNVDHQSLSTACTLLVSLVGFMIMYRIMRPMTKIHWAIWGTMLAGLIFCLFNLRWFYSIEGMTRQVALLMIVFGIIAEPMMRYLGLLAEWVRRKMAGSAASGRGLEKMTKKANHLEKARGFFLTNRQ